MFQKTVTSFFALMSVFVPFADANENTFTEVDSKTAMKLNQQTKNSIASSWFDLPETCKAKNFNADPVIIDRKEHSKQVTEIFSSFS